MWHPRFWIIAGNHHQYGLNVLDMSQGLKEWCNSDSMAWPIIEHMSILANTALVCVTVKLSLMLLDVTRWLPTGHLSQLIIRLGTMPLFLGLLPSFLPEVVDLLRSPAMAQEYTELSRWIISAFSLDGVIGFNPARLLFDACTIASFLGNLVLLSLPFAVEACSPESL